MAMMKGLWRRLLLGANAFASYTDEDIILNMIGEGGVTIDDFASNEKT
jgi:hypothetical protein